MCYLYAQSTTDFRNEFEKNKNGNKTRKRKTNVHIPMDKTKTTICFIPLIFRLKEKQKHLNEKLCHRDFTIRKNSNFV